ncbi:hypothetical protein ACFYNX_31040 [Streptomyces sp. NPDC007872]|uniref:hypothetical protein n=1 Tax=Streptomyces sp. NPDC007872 TaxID=3364782 RepID=UPI00369D7CB6
MIYPVAGPPTRRHLAAALAITALISALWYGLQPVYPDCVYFGNHSIEQAVEYGQCDPPKTRFNTWTH